MKLANCIQYTIFYSNHDDLTPSHSYALKLKSLEIAFGDGIVLLFTPFTVTRFSLRSQYPDILSLPAIQSEPELHAIIIIAYPIFLVHTLNDSLNN